MTARLYATTAPGAGPRPPAEGAHGVRRCAPISRSAHLGKPRRFLRRSAPFSKMRTKNCAPSNAGSKSCPQWGARAMQSSVTASPRLADPVLNSPCPASKDWSFPVLPPLAIVRAQFRGRAVTSSKAGSGSPIDSPSSFPTRQEAAHVVRPSNARHSHVRDVSRCDERRRLAIGDDRRAPDVLLLFGNIVGGACSFYSSGASAESMDRHAHLVSRLFVRVVRRGPRRS